MLSPLAMAYTGTRSGAVARTRKTRATLPQRQQLQNMVWQQWAGNWSGWLVAGLRDAFHRADAAYAAAKKLPIGPQVGSWNTGGWKGWEDWSGWQDRGAGWAG